MARRHAALEPGPDDALVRRDLRVATGHAEHRLERLERELVAAEQAVELARLSVGCRGLLGREGRRRRGEDQGDRNSADRGHEPSFLGEATGPATGGTARSYRLGPGS